ncbi:MAG TPA: type III-B CRISPR module RAMP protein Cmr1 [Cyanobacteria bacterium UBA8803]|nr:type III-B CRISPR module RAMP protein Cmr1 [Cyanobacteria bacterium UBA9273]HBL59077.1 type III-B CRISPR module RAMP protein Cmr1 [Cyanobacteria bacterium UBA8803]
MEVNVKTLTPLWTGGVEAGKCDRIHETGILGSLRWWMEVLVRGVGGNACDPTEQKCSRKNGLCDVCKIFGAEGQKRRFRLEIEETQVSNATIKHPIQANRTYTDKQSKQKTPTWYFPKPPNTPKTDTFTLKIQSLNPDFKPEIIGGLIQFIADWSALGARPQMGFGVIEIEERIDIQPLYDWLFSIAGSNIYPDLPSLPNIFLAQIQPKDSNPSFQEEDTFNLKYDLRQLFRTEQNPNKSRDEDGKPRPKKKGDGDKDLRHFIMGTVEGDRIAAKVKISRSYENDKLMRVWGWIPEEADVYKNGWNREKVVDAIYQHLAAKYTLHDWREMNSMRDTKTPNISDAKVFLRSLLKLQEDG